MGALEQAKSRYESTPRPLDRELNRLSRGDRGCLTDLVSAIGAVLTVVLVVLVNVEILPSQWVWVGAAVWVGGFLAGAVGQIRSGRRRSLALREGPLVYAQIVQAQDHLFAADNGKRTGKAVVVFSTQPERAFDRPRLAAVAQRLAHMRQSITEGRAAPDAATWPSHLARLFEDPFAVDFVALDPDWVGEAGYWCTQVAVYPERLDRLEVRRDEVIALIVAPAEKFAEHVSAG